MLKVSLRSVGENNWLESARGRRIARSLATSAVLELFHPPLIVVKELG